MITIQRNGDIGHFSYNCISAITACILTERKKKERIFKAMVFTEDYIATLPVIGDEQEGEFYAEGEFEAAVLSDFNKEADIIDAQCCRLEML